MERRWVMDDKLEGVVLPVSDVGKARDFRTGLGWRLDARCAAGDHYPPARPVIRR
jgi:hypothetical protein